MRGVFFKLRIRTTSLVFDNFSPFDSTANNIVNFEGEQKRLSLSIEKEVSRGGRKSPCQIGKTYLVVKIMVLVNPVFESQVGENVRALGYKDLAYRVPEGK